MAGFGPAWGSLKDLPQRVGTIICNSRKRFCAPFTGLRTVAGAKFLSHFAFRGVAQNCTILEETHEHKGRFQRGVYADSLAGMPFEKRFLAHSLRVGLRSRLEKHSSLAECAKIDDKLVLL
ncbi:MAG: hypothetical protein ABJB70_04470 [Candidatus Udaeobacter sp.]